MFPSRLRCAARVKRPQAEKTHGLASKVLFRKLLLERLESRIAPATASLNFPSGYYPGNGAGGLVMDVPIDASDLSTGLSAATIALTFPPGVFAFPTGGSAATADVSLGAIPGAAGGDGGLATFRQFHRRRQPDHQPQRPQWLCRQQQHCRWQPGAGQFPRFHQL
jgi:hypothetical protein